MADKKIPFVAIIGGFYHMQDPKEIARAQKMANKIGIELAKAGMGLVVYNSDPNSLEPHIVTGFVQATPKGGGERSIRVRYADSQRNLIKFAEQGKRHELFDMRLFPGQNWELPFYQSLAEAEGVDAVLLMAGGTSTLIAGQIVVARSLPVLAIDTFDGSARTIWTQLVSRAPDYPSASTKSLPELVAGLKKECDVRAEKLARIRRNEEHYQRIISQKSKGWYTGLTFLLLFVVFMLGIRQAPEPQTYSALTFLGLIVAGATGALVRSYYWGTEDTAPYTSLLLGGIAGLVVGLAYLIPQWIGAPGLLDPSATQVSATDKVQFVSAVLVALPAGIGFDTIFNRMKKQAEEQSIQLPK